MEGQELWYFLFIGEVAKKSSRIVLQCIFGRDFLSLRTAELLGIENYPSISISCCSDGLAQLLPCLDLVCGLQMYQSKNKFLLLIHGSSAKKKLGRPAGLLVVQTDSKLSKHIEFM